MEHDHNNRNHDILSSNNREQDIQILNTRYRAFCLDHFLLHILELFLGKTKSHMDGRSRVLDNHQDIPRCKGSLKHICHGTTNTLSYKDCHAGSCSNIRKPKYHKCVHKLIYHLDTLNDLLNLTIDYLLFDEAS